MRQLHKVEVLRREHDDGHEAWTNPDGSVRVHREGASWGVVLDGRPVLELERKSHEGQITITGVPLTAPSLHALAARMSLERRLHLVFDA